MKKMSWLCVALVLALVAPRAFAGPKIDFGDEGNLKLSFLGQFHANMTDGAADEDDMYVRRARFVVAGQICDGIKVFVETDNDNLGKAGVNSSMDIQDAWIDLRIAEGHWVQAGLILLPFSLENRASAASLLGIDYNAECIKLVNTHVWRDTGIEFHGNIMDWVAYRVGVFDGYDGATKNPDAGIRITGRFDVNVIGSVEKGGWFYSQNRLGKEQYLVIGAGIDMQDEATAVAGDDDTTTVMDNTSWVVDLQSSFDVTDDVALLLNGAYYDYDNAAFVGNTAFAELGVLYQKAMLTAKYSMQDPESGDSVSDVTVGLHYFLNGQAARAGLEYRTGDSADQILAGVQCLL